MIAQLQKKLTILSSIVQDNGGMLGMYDHSTSIMNREIITSFRKNNEEIG